MSVNRSAAVALVGGFLAGLVTMALHPTGSDVIHEASEGSSNVLVVAVHVLALLGQGVVLSGALALTRELRRRRDLAIAGYVFFALGAVSVIFAAAASGLLAPTVLRGYGEASEASRATMLQFLRYTGLLNQTFAKMNVMFSCVAILLWSVATFSGRELGRGLGIYGMVVAATLLAGIATGVLTLGVHGFGLVVLSQGVWLAWAAARLWRSGLPE
jgi:hypothetical protein